MRKIREVLRQRLQCGLSRRETDARIQQMQERGFPPLPAVPTLPGWRRWNTMT
jgi:hypothetical protein